MNNEANISGFRDGNKVAPFRSGNVYNMFDGKKLDALHLDNVILQSQEDCTELIKFLNIHRFCFNVNSYSTALKQIEEYERRQKRDYEVISMRSLDDGKIYTVDTDTIDYYIQHNNQYGKEAYKVKRLSDGKVFTIGDRIRSKYFAAANEIRTIKKFSELTSSTIQVIQSGGSIPLNDIEHAPLFITTDGKEIFEGENAWFVFEDFQYQKITCWGNNSGKFKAIFSTEERAKEYILMNKPCLCYKDILNSIVGLDSQTWKKLKELVKQKQQ